MQFKVKQQMMAVVEAEVTVEAPTAEQAEEISWEYPWSDLEWRVQSRVKHSDITVVSIEPI